MADLDYVPSNLRLARFPVHWISSAPASPYGPDMRIDSDSYCDYWEVMYGSPPKAPGALGMRIDKLVVNPALHSQLGAGRRAQFIRLGSLRSIARQTGAGQGNTTGIVRALKDNAAVQIRIGWGAVQWQRRYDVFLPDDRMTGRKVADAVYIRPTDFYRDWVRGAAWSIRLRRDLLRDLPPASARLYEILASLRRRSTASLLYSDICRYVPLRSGTKSDSPRSVLSGLHEPLVARGVIAGVAYEEIEYIGTIMRSMGGGGDVIGEKGYFSLPLVCIDSGPIRDWEVRYVYGEDAETAFQAEGHNIQVGWEVETSVMLKDIPGIGPDPMPGAAGQPPGGVN